MRCSRACDGWKAVLWSNKMLWTRTITDFICLVSFFTSSAGLVILGFFCLATDFLHWAAKYHPLFITSISDPHPRRFLIFSMALSFALMLTMGSFLSLVNIAPGVSFSLTMHMLHFLSLIERCTSFQATPDTLKLPGARDVISLAHYKRRKRRCCKCFILYDFLYDRFRCLPFAVCTFLFACLTAYQLTVYGDVLFGFDLNSVFNGQDLVSILLTYPYSLRSDEGQFSPRGNLLAHQLGHTCGFLEFACFSREDIFTFQRTLAVITSQLLVACIPLVACMVFFMSNSRYHSLFWSLPALFQVYGLLYAFVKLPSLTIPVFSAKSVAVTTPTPYSTYSPLFFSPNATLFADVCGEVVHGVTSATMLGAIAAVHDVAQVLSLQAAMQAWILLNNSMLVSPETPALVAKCIIQSSVALFRPKPEEQRTLVLQGGQGGGESEKEPMQYPLLSTVRALVGNFSLTAVVKQVQQQLLSGLVHNAELTACLRGPLSLAELGEVYKALGQVLQPTSKDSQGKEQEVITKDLLASVKRGMADAAVSKIEYLMHDHGNAPPPTPIPVIDGIESLPSFSQTAFRLTDLSRLLVQSTEQATSACLSYFFGESYMITRVLYSTMSVILVILMLLRLLWFSFVYLVWATLGWHPRLSRVSLKMIQAINDGLMWLRRQAIKQAGRVLQLLTRKHEHVLVKLKSVKEKVTVKLLPRHSVASTGMGILLLKEEDEDDENDNDDSLEKSPAARAFVYPVRFVAACVVVILMLISVPIVGYAKAKIGRFPVAQFLRAVGALEDVEPYLDLFVAAVPLCLGIGSLLCSFALLQIIRGFRKTCIQLEPYFTARHSRRSVLVVRADTVLAGNIGLQEVRTSDLADDKEGSAGQQVNDETLSTSPVPLACDSSSSDVSTAYQLPNPEEKHAVRNYLLARGLPIHTASLADMVANNKVCLSQGWVFFGPFFMTHFVLILSVGCMLYLITLIVVLAIVVKPLNIFLANHFFDLFNWVTVGLVATVLIWKFIGDRFVISQDQKTIRHPSMFMWLYDVPLTVASMFSAAPLVAVRWLMGILLALVMLFRVDRSLFPNSSALVMDSAYAQYGAVVALYLHKRCVELGINHPLQGDLYWENGGRRFDETDRLQAEADLLATSEDKEETAEKKGVADNADRGSGTGRRGPKASVAFTVLHLRQRDPVADSSAYQPPEPVWTGEHGEKGEEEKSVGVQSVSSNSLMLNRTLEHSPIELIQMNNTADNDGAEKKGKMGPVGPAVAGFRMHGGKI